MRDSTIFYRSFWEAIKTLPKEDQPAVYDSIFELAFNNKKTELEGVGKGIMTLITPNIEANNKRFASGSKAKQKQSRSKREATRKRGQSNIGANANKDVNKDKDVDKDIDGIIELFNDTCKLNYKKESKVTRGHISARLKEGFVVDDFKAVIELKNRQWGSDSKMRGYLRPETLFCTKFEGYVNEAKRPDSSKNIHLVMDAN